jgi:hypothetical protein
MFGGLSNCKIDGTSTDHDRTFPGILAAAFAGGLMEPDFKYPLVLTKQMIRKDNRFPTPSAGDLKLDRKAEIRP